MIDCREKCFVFDIDGTIANCEHRRQWVITKPQNWNVFNSLMENDTPIIPTIELLRAITISREFSVVLLTGREGSFENKFKTQKWLQKNGVLYDDLYMREHKDYRCDAIVKLELMKEVEQNYKVMGIFDDRKKVVDMWRQEGYYVFDVNQTGEVF